MAFTDETYYRGEINIPNRDKENVLEALELFINQFEPEVLLCALGRDLYDSFTSGLDESSPLQKWLDLRNGKTYEVDYNGSTCKVKWNGLINASKISLLSYYVYYQSVKNELDFNTGLGIYQTMAENAQQSDARNRMAHIWSKFLALYGDVSYDNKPHKNHFGIDSYCNESSKYERSSDGLAFFPSDGGLYYSNVLEPSLYNYIKAMNEQNGDDYYPNWKFTIKEPITNFI